VILPTRFDAEGAAGRIVPEADGRVVCSLLGFSRGKASSIVSELSGRDPETRKVDEARIPIAYDTLESALLAVVKK